MNFIARYVWNNRIHFTLDPPVEPTITKISANQTIVEGERVTFTCQATGNPLPQITWKVFLESGDDSASQLERPSPQSIRISSANPKDAGQYLCIAENDSGNDTEAVYLNVVGEYYIELKIKMPISYRKCMSGKVRVIRRKENNTKNYFSSI